MSKTEYKSNLTETQKFENLIKHGNPLVMPLKIRREDLSKEKFEFTYSINGKKGVLIIQNYLVKQPW